MANIIFIDNFDSFSYNLVDEFMVLGHNVDVYRNNLSLDFLIEKKYAEDGYLNPPKGEVSKSWKKTKRLIFKSTIFGDDTDRALQKDDGSWTYFANDIGYHSDKISRNYNYLINIL